MALCTDNVHSAVLGGAARWLLPVSPWRCAAQGLVHVVGVLYAWPFFKYLQRILTRSCTLKQGTLPFVPGLAQDTGGIFVKSSLVSSLLEVCVAQRWCNQTMPCVSHQGAQGARRGRNGPVGGGEGPRAGPRAVRRHHQGQPRLRALLALHQQRQPQRGRDHDVRPRCLCTRCST